MRISAIQMTSAGTVEESLQDVDKLIREAAGQGASFIATPECTDSIITHRKQHMDRHYAEAGHPGIPFFSNLAKELEVTLLAGSFFILQDHRKFLNRSYLFGPDGAIKATYDKIHRFDVDLENGESYRESDLVDAGERMVLSAVDGVPLGMTICYDMRFPHLYRDLAKAGAQMISVPAAFSVPTGKAHWHVLLRARAIETGAFVIAPAQVGLHEGGRQTYGHSLIVAPWGDIIAERTEDTPGYIMADLDFSLVEKARNAVPSLRHDRPYMS